MTPPTSRRLLELKARSHQLPKARKWADAHATLLGSFQQIDTYFQVHQGRLKVRETGGETGTLIFYLREDEPSLKRSRVLLQEVSNARELKELLTEALGVLTTVEKRRTIYRWGQVQIHLDEVAGLGDYIEFERMLASSEDERAAEAEFHHLQSAFNISENDMVAGSYSDLLLSRGAKQ